MLFSLVEVNTLLGEYYCACMKALDYSNQPIFYLLVVIPEPDCPEDVNFALH